jgi:hypothetical protein
LFLTIVEIDGMLAYLVEQRTREIGIRMALGSAVPRVVRLILGQSLRLGVLGAVIWRGTRAQSRAGAAVGTCHWSTRLTGSRTRVAS